MDKFDAIVTDLKNNKQPNINLCDCYHEREEKHYFTDFERGVRFAEGLPNKEYEIRKVPYCAGTKECEICKCNGDRIKCDFYEDVRRKAKSNQLKKSNLKRALENLETLIDVAVDYDGYQDAKNLMELIDELRDYAKKARKNILDYVKEEKNNG